MRNKLTLELAVCGRNAVRALAEYHPEKINRLFLHPDLMPVCGPLCRDLAARKRPYKMCEDEELERICKSTHHQGIVAMIFDTPLPPLPPKVLDDWCSNNWTGLILPACGNDLNLGAIIRAAAFFDVKLVVLPAQDESVLRTTSAYRVAEGGMEHVELYVVRDMAAFTEAAVKKGVIVLGADNRARFRLKDLARVIEEKRTPRADSKAPSRGASIQKEAQIPPIALVLGNEENGIPPDIKAACSALLRAPGTGLLDSLNVSQAAALFLHEIYSL